MILLNEENGSKSTLKACRPFYLLVHLVSRVWWCDGDGMVQEHAVSPPGGPPASFLFSPMAKVGGVVGTACRAETGDSRMRAQ